MARSNRGHQENLLFKFALITDTHLKLSAGTEEMLWSTHHLANVRTQFALQQISLAEPDFVIHLGDMIHPVPGLPDYAPTAKLFERMFSRLECPFYVTPGNHDIGDKARAGMPAAVVDQASVDAFHEAFGASYQAFDHGGCRCLLINSPILNSGLPVEEEQRRWLEAELADHREKRLFLFMHYPPFVRAPDELEHYDNIDEPARSWLLGLIERYPVEAVFTGHAHTFFYNQYAASDLYVLPSVTFMRMDYSELFRIGPAPDYGRNDLDKFGFFVVWVYEDGHAVQFVRTAGQTLEAPDDSRPQRTTLPPSVSDPRTEPVTAPLGVELRHPWAEIVDIPYNYILDEFVRRKVRNDYPILAMWEMGVRHVRVPLSDLVDPRVRGRMQALRRKGYQFTVFSFGVPRGAALDAVTQYATGRGASALIDTLEVILLWEDAAEAMPRLRAIKDQTSIRIHLSKLAVSRDFAKAFDQYIRPGFRSDDGEIITTFMTGEGVSDVVDGFAFRIGPDADPWDEVLAIAELAREGGYSASITLQLASDSEAGVVDDELLLARHVATAAAAASVASELDVFVDTFVDMDRGYYVRHGLLDRRYNPRQPGLVLRNLSALLSPRADGPHGGAVAYYLTETIGNRHMHRWETQHRHYVLLHADPDATMDGQLYLQNWPTPGSFGAALCHDLITGASQTIPWRRDQQMRNEVIILRLPAPIPSLALLVIEKADST